MIILFYIILQKELDSLAEQLQYSFRAKHGVIYNWKSRAILAEALRYVDSLESGTPQKPKSDLYYKEEKPHAMEFADLQEGDSYEDDNNEF